MKKILQVSLKNFLLAIGVLTLTMLFFIGSDFGRGKHLISMDGERYSSDNQYSFQLWQHEKNKAYFISINEKDIEGPIYMLDLPMGKGEPGFISWGKNSQDIFMEHGVYGPAMYIKIKENWVGPCYVDTEKTKAMDDDIFYLLTENRQSELFLQEQDRDSLMVKTENIPKFFLDIFVYELDHGYYFQ